MTKKTEIKTDHKHYEAPHRVDSKPLPAAPRPMKTNEYPTKPVKYGSRDDK